MKYCRLKTTNPYLNLAIEEYFFENADEEVFILWQNEPTVVIGKNQNAFAEINMDYLKENKIKIARRITGGGAVYHDLGNVNYSYISPSERGLDFKYFSGPIIDVLSTLGVEVALSGRNDLLTKDGKKISGTAEHTSRGRTLHHGTLLFDSNLGVLSSVLNVDPEKLRANAVKSTRSRVANLKGYMDIDASASAFIDSLEQGIIERFSPTVINPPNNGEISELCKRNSSDEWIYPDNDYLSLYNIIKRKKFDFGLVEINMSIKNGQIKKIKILGDFFELSDVSRLEEQLSGKNLSDVSEILSELSVGDFILGMSNGEFLELIKK